MHNGKASLTPFVSLGNLMMLPCYAQPRTIPLIGAPKAQMIDSGEKQMSVKDVFAVRKVRLAIAVFAGVSLSGASETPIAQASESEPDFKLAYVLATASYCAYAVGELDRDHGQTRAFDCLQAAAAKDPAHLERLKIASKDDVEAYFNPQAPRDAYLLIHEKEGLILAFRGTLVPPISPSSGQFAKATAETVVAYKERGAAALGTFGLDWFNNTQARSNNLGRHYGFDQSWQGLRSHLETDCAPNSVKEAEGNECSKFRSFVEGLKSSGPHQGLFITGHSKGGALATLAALDIPDMIGAKVKTTVYSFEAAKSLTSAVAADLVDQTRGIWRFEYKNDIVPSLPPDATVDLSWLGIPPYAHVGRLAFIEKSKPPSFLPPNAVNPVSDAAKLAEFSRHVTTTQLQVLLSPTDLSDAITRLLNLGETGCRPFVDNHFAVFADIQEIVWAKDRENSGPVAVTEANWDRSFFAIGLPDEKGTILWGFRQWCQLFGILKAN